MIEPRLSVILLCPDEFATIRKTVLHLARQTIRESLELVFVAPPDFHWEGEEIAGFGKITFVPFDPASVGEAYAAGIRAASGVIVVLSEDHSFPQSGWAEALVEAHNEDYAAVGPAIANANPHTLVSRADILCAYGPWMHPATSGEQEHLPGHNSSYKRAILLQYGDRLGAMMAAESVLHWDLRRRGFRLFLEARAVTAHMNFEAWRSWRSVQFHSGRMFSTTRSVNEGWSPLRRIVFALASPLIPMVRMARTLPVLTQPGRKFISHLPALPLLLVGFCISAIGEATGALNGHGGSVRIMWDMEFHRELHKKTAR